MSAAGRYGVLRAAREQYLVRARDAAALTIPALMPRDGFNDTSVLPTPYQSVGARGVTSLAAKLTLALFPPNTPFFRFFIPEASLTEIIGQQKSPEAADQLLSEIERGLAKAEKKIMWEFETRALRAKVHELLEHLIVAGNALLFFAPKATLPQVFHLDQYVVRRSPSGEVLEIVVVEKVSWGAVPQAIRNVLPKEEKDVPDDKEYALYTHVRRSHVDEAFTYYQEIEGYIVPDSQGTYAKTKPIPWLPLRWRAIDGRSYGRSFVEEYLGDLASLESLVRSTVIGAAASAKVLFLVKPNSTTRIATLSGAPSGSFREGNKDDVGCLQTEKHADMQMAINLGATIETRLKEAFLLASSVTRQAERVTATEIQLLAQELEDTLGGVYTLMSLELQRPIVTVLMEDMRRTGKLALPAKSLEIHILTGLEALGRTADLRRLDTLVDGIAERFGPEAVTKVVILSEYLARRAAALAIDTGGLIRTDEQVQAIAQAEQQAAMQQQLAPQMMGQAAPILKGVSDAESNGTAASGTTQAMIDRTAQSIATP